MFDPCPLHVCLQLCSFDTASGRTHALLCYLQLWGIFILGLTFTSFELIYTHLYGMRAPLFLALTGLAAAHPASVLNKRQSYVGIATFNDYSAQGNTNCGPKSGQSGTYGAAASDISPNVSGGTCSGSIDPSQCSGQSPIAGWTPPSCPKSNCGKCYSVTHTGSIGGSVGGIGNTITVQIIDACASTSASNYCKTDMPSTQTCGDSGTNQLDIDTSAYMALTGQAFGNGPTLNIAISPSCCPGESGCSASTSSNAGSTSQTPATPASDSSSGSGGNVAAKENVAEKVGASPKAAETTEDDSDPCPEL